MNTIFFILEMAVIFIAVLFLSSDVRRKGYPQKVFWMWAIALAAGLFIFGLFGLGALGLLVVLVLYFLWSRSKQTD